MTSTRVWCTMVMVAVAAGACDRSTSVGAAGRHSDGAIVVGTDGSDASTDAADASTPDPAQLCASTGGTVTSANCCASVGAFPDTCAIGACGCSPAASASVMTCSCPTGCFSPGLGCVGPADACTQGMDLSCNQDSTATSPRGHCVTGNRCLCSPGAQLSSTGKCL